MATQEYLLRYIEANKRYTDLPARVKLAVTEEEWGRRVRSFCIHRGAAWAGSPAAEVVAEHDYYDALLSFYRGAKRIYPYHLGSYVARVARVTPFRYYRELLADAMREDLPYDAIPNFAAADAVAVLGVGRNEYIATMVQAKSKKLLWRMNKGIAKDLLPAEPRPVDPEPWWTVNLVNLREEEHRSLTRGELEVCRAAAAPGGAPVARLNPGLVNYLYRRGLVWLDVPVGPGDHLSIPPLEGFVSNKTAAPGGGDAVDPIETLMYQVFVAASDRVTVDKLASILNVDVGTLAVAISVACRLKFCRKLDGGGGGGGAAPFGGLPPPLEAPQASADPLDGASTALAGLDLESALVDTPNPAAAAGLAPAPPPGGLAEGSPRGGGGVALVVDSEVTGFLMMGALTPAVKKHSVTLFEGGRVYGPQVIAELVEELQASVALAAGFEGEMAALAGTAAALAAVLGAVRACAGGRPIELLRKESLGGLDPEAAFRILSHSYDVVLPVAGLPAPPLPLSVFRRGPTNYGPTAAAATPWLHLALYAAAGRAPASLVLPAGSRLARLPPALAAAGAALAWPWDPAAVRAPPSDPLILGPPSLLHSLNHLLTRTAVLVQPVGAGAAEIAAVPLPLPLEAPASTAAAESDADSTNWAHFEEAPGAPGEGAAAAPPAAATGFFKDGTSVAVELPPGLPRALEAIGMGGAVGSLRLLRAGAGGEWAPLALTLGVPLAPLPLCEAVCAAAAARGFLGGERCAAHEAGQRTLAAALGALAAAHGLAAPVDGAADLAAAVPLPLQALAVDARGRVAPTRPGAAVQGPGGLVHAAAAVAS